MLFVADWLVIILLLYLRTKIRIYVGCIGKVILLLLPNMLSFLFTLIRVLYNLSKTIIYVCLFLPINYRQINVTNLINERDKSSTFINRKCYSILLLYVYRFTLGYIIHIIALQLKMFYKQILFIVESKTTNYSIKTRHWNGSFLMGMRILCQRRNNTINTM